MLKQISLLLAVVIIGIYAVSDEPMVAFSCGYGAVRTEGGHWKTDLTTDCLSDKKQILDYCKESYPNLEVTNIVEDSEILSIEGWCRTGSKMCATPETFKTRPYRCLTGPFQSDSLTVPQKCKFDHIRDSTECETFQYWEHKASEACLLKSMRIKSSGMLLPCEVDKFTGVEYVCCPVTEKSSDRSDDQESSTKKSENNGKTLGGLEKDNDIHKYIVMPESDYKDDEHTKFEKVKKGMIEQNQAKLDKLMKDWRDASDKVEAMKKIDPKGAEKLSKDITPRFRQEYIAQQALGESKLLQLDVVHQQHIQTNLNDKKRHAAQKILKEIEKGTINERKLEKFLEKYISIEEKDARHCIQHYLKIRNRDPQASKALLSVTTEHLAQIKQKIDSVIKLLDSLNDKTQAARLKQKVVIWLEKKYANLDKTIRLLVEDGDRLAQQKRAPAEQKLPFEVEKPDEETKTPSITFELKAPQVPNHEIPRVKIGVIHKESNVDDAKVDVPIVKMEPVNQFVGKLSDLTMNKMLASELNIDPGVQPVGHNHESSVRSSVWIIIGCVGGVLLVFTIVVVVINKKRAAKYEQVNINEKYTTPEEECVATLQQNGFENPTYRYLEQQSV